MNLTRLASILLTVFAAPLCSSAQEKVFKAGAATSNITPPFNWVHKFTPDFVAVEKIKVPCQTAYGIQIITFGHGNLWLGTYSKERT